MKLYLLLIGAMLCARQIHAQNVGIGTASPTEKLDVAGAIKISGTTNTSPAKGTMRWNDLKNDFEGYNGKAWVSLTGGKSGWGNQVDYSYESQGDQSPVHGGAQNGYSVAAEYPFVVTGAPYNNGGGSKEWVGGIRLYKHVNDTWLPLFITVPQDLPSSSVYGRSVGISGGTVAVGADNFDVGANINQGKVFVYSLNTLSGWLDKTQELTASEGNKEDYFGRSITMQANRMIIGAPGNDIGLVNNQGSAYIFEKLSGAWQQTARLTHSNPHAGDQMGNVVALHGSWAAMGSPSAYVDNNDWHGKVALFQYNGSAWVQAQTLTAPGGSIRKNFFGQSLQLSGDTLLVGMPERNEASNAIGNGKVFLYTRNGTAWTLQNTITASDGAWGDGFGWSVQLSGGYLLVGARYANVGGSTAQGKAYVFKKEGDAWVQQAILTNSHGDIHDGFGASVALVQGHAVVGAPGADVNSNSNAGRIFFFKH